MKLKDSEGNVVTVPKKYRSEIKRLMEAGDHDGISSIMDNIGKVKTDLSHMEKVKDFKGPSHESGGIAYTDDAEVQGNELSFDFGKEMGEYIFPDPKDSEIGAAARKRVKLRDKRKDDRISNDSMKSELSALAQLNELDRFTKGATTQNPSLYSKGGFRRMYAEGGIPDIVDGDPMIPMTPKGVDNGILADSQLTPMNVPNAQTEVGSRNRMTDANNAIGYATQAAQVAGSITGATLDTSHQVPESQALSVPMDSVMSAIPVVGQYYQLGNAVNAPIKDWQSDARGRGAKGEATAAATISGVIDPMDGWSQNAQAYEDGVISESEAARNLAVQFFLPGFANNAVAEAYDKKAKSDAFNKNINTRMSDRSSNMTNSFTYGDRGYGGKNRYATGGVRKWDPKGTQWSDPNGGFIVPDDVQNKMDTHVANNPYDFYTTSPDVATVEDAPYLHETPKKQLTPEQRQQYINMGKSIAGGLANNIGNFALLAEGKDYDRVSYPTMTPELISDQLGQREARDMYGTALEQAKNSGKLDINTLAAVATQGAKTTAGVRESVNNLNAQTKNAAKQFNVSVAMQQEAANQANKDAVQNRYYDNLKEIGTNLAGSMYEQSKLDSQAQATAYDKMLKDYLMSTFDGMKYQQR